MTLAPASTNRRTQAAPIPREPPVINATRPSRESVTGIVSVLVAVQRASLQLQLARQHADQHAVIAGAAVLLKLRDGLRAAPGHREGAVAGHVGIGVAYGDNACP